MPAFSWRSGLSRTRPLAYSGVSSAGAVAWANTYLAADGNGLLKATGFQLTPTGKLWPSDDLHDSTPTEAPTTRPRACPERLPHCRS